MILTPGLTQFHNHDEHPSHRFDQSQPSYSGHREDYATDDEVDPYADDIQEKEEIAEQEEQARPEPRGILAQFMHALPRDQWPTDSDGKFWLRDTGKG